MLGEAAELRLARPDRRFGVPLRGNVDGGADEPDRAPLLKIGSAGRGDVAHDAVISPDYAVFDGVAPVSGRVGAGGDRVVDTGPIFGMYARLEGR